MSKKFTQQQFNQLVEIQQDKFPGNLITRGAGFKTILESIREYDTLLSDYIIANGLSNQALALMNPVSRDLVKNDLVDTSKRYFFTVEVKDDLIYSLNRATPGSTMIYFDADDPTPLTFDEVAGYNLDLFDVEEVPEDL